MTIWIGTASWADKSLIETGRFYPPGVNSPESRLRHYATQFPLVEIDSSFYAIPRVETARLWSERTPDGFAVNVKAFRLFTGHQTSPAVLPAEVRDALPAPLKLKSVLYYNEVPDELIDELWHRFSSALQPLQDSSRLRLVHFQFPPWLVRNRAGRAHVAHCVERMADQKVSVEFRSEGWFEGGHAAHTLAFQRGLGAVHTIVDEPSGLANSVPGIWETTRSDLALVRMHGRNAAAWNDRSGHSGGRFNYDYDDAELEGLAHQIQQLDRPGLDVHVILNNNHEDQAQRNGRTLFKTMSALGSNLARLPIEEQFELLPPA